MSNYKEEQKLVREKLKPKLIYSGPTLDLGIRKMKKNTPDFELRKIYKENVWKSKLAATRD